MNDYRQSPIWKTAFAEQDDGLKDQRAELADAFVAFRDRVSLLVGQIHKDLPDLTAHDTHHIDALWWIASEIAGESYRLNPAEAFVLGGAFLLHDAAHSLAAYPGGINEIRALPEWDEYAAGKRDLEPGTPAFQLVLFDVLRNLHPKQARKLANLSWQAPGDVTPLFLLPHDELRMAYADAIGRIAESHWWSPHELEAFAHQRLTAPACLHPATWDVDLLKLAVLLRTADAAHLDAQRAPRFLLALVKPGGTSLIHWQFQSRMNQVQRDPDPARKELRLSAAPFPVTEQEAWWLAFDAARLIDKELRAADRLLLEHGRPRLAARHLSAANSPEDFARSVPADDWQPVDASIRISDVKSLVDRFGGEKLYGDEPWKALRELLQNAIDAIHACRALGGLGPEEGEIEVAVDDVEGGHWLHVTDTGIGMSRYVLTEVLLDFGHSLWRSPDLRGEWSGLKATGFEAIGQFGIGFFAVFMLGEHVKVTTRRYEAKEGENGQWLLEFPAGTEKRPVLRVPGADERLKRHGTRVSVFVTHNKLNNLGPVMKAQNNKSSHANVGQTCAWLAPAIDIDFYLREQAKPRELKVLANDWLTLPPRKLLDRIYLDKADVVFYYYLEPWEYLSEINGEDGAVIGRCAVVAINMLSMWSNPGVGVIKGLRAGPIQNIAGLITVNSQSDLARKSATPDLSLKHVQSWGRTQKQLIGDRFSKRYQGRYVYDISALLCRLGVDFSGLVVGSMGDNEIVFEALVLNLKGATELVVHDGAFQYNDTDEILPREFNNEFVPNSEVLEFISSYREPDWLNHIDQTGFSRDNWSLEAALDNALQIAWGGFEWLESDREVGWVNVTPIIRECRVAVRTNEY